MLEWLSRYRDNCELSNEHINCEGTNIVTFLKINLFDKPDFPVALEKYIFKHSTTVLVFVSDYLKANYIAQINL